MIGRLMTDEAFRQRVEKGGSACLAGLRKHGVDLNRQEIAVLVETDPQLWSNWRNGSTGVCRMAVWRLSARVRMAAID